MQPPLTYRPGKGAQPNPKSLDQRAKAGIIVEAILERDNNAQRAILLRIPNGDGQSRTLWVPRSAVAQVAETRFRIAAWLARKEQLTAARRAPEDTTPPKPAQPPRNPATPPSGTPRAPAADIVITVAPGIQMRLRPTQARAIVAEINHQLDAIAREGAR